MTTLGGAAIRMTSDASFRPEFWRTFAAPISAGHRYILELSSRFDASQEQATSTHVTATDELDWKQQSFTEDIDEGFGVLGGRDAAEQHDNAVGAKR